MSKAARRARRAEARKQESERKNNRQTVPPEPTSVPQVATSTDAKPQSRVSSRDTNGRIRRLFEVLAGIVTLLSIMQLFLKPTVQSPIPTLPQSPVSLPFEIKNENLLPLLHVEYVCNVVTLRFKNSRSRMDDFSAAIGHPRTLWGRDTMTGRCDQAMRLTGFAIQQAEYRLDLRYFALPFPIAMHPQYSFVAIVDDEGRVSRWVPK